MNDQNDSHRVTIFPRQRRAECTCGWTRSCSHPLNINGIADFHARKHGAHGINFNYEEN